MNSITCSLYKEDIEVILAKLLDQPTGLNQRMIQDELIEYFTQTLRESRSISGDET